jgi:hypothetical protein
MATALHQAEAAVTRASKIAIRARSELTRAAAGKDGRMIALLGTNHPDRIRHTEAHAASMKAEDVLHAAKAHLEELKAKARDKASPRRAREQLKTALADLHRHERAASRHQAALARGEEMVRAAFAQTEASASALGHAGEADAKKAAAAAAGGKRALPAGTITKRRAELETAEAALATARSAREMLEGEGTELTAAVDKAKAKIDTAVTDVLKAELPVQAMIQRCTEATKTLVDARITLREMVRAGITTEEQRRQIEHMFCAELPPPHGFAESYTARWHEHPVATRWHAMRDRLVKDADAKIDIE